MSVYKPAKSRFWQYDFVIRRARYHGSTGQVTRRAAEKWEARERERIADGANGSAENVTLDQASGRWWDDIGQHRGDAVDVERRLEVLAGLIGSSTPISAIDADMVSGAIRKRRVMPYTKSKAKGAAKYYPGPATVNRDIIETLRPVLRYAAELWANKGLKVQTIRWGKLRLSEPAPQVKVYSAAEQEAWRAECGPTTGFALDLLLTYGLRLGELFFELGDFEAEGGRLNVRSRMMPNGARRRGRKHNTNTHILPLRPAHAREIAARVGRASAAGLDHIWFVEVKDERSGEIALAPLTYYGLQGRLNTASERASVTPGRIIHGARHHAATTALRRTGSLPSTGKLLGHASLRSTERYAHVLEEDLRAAIGEADDSSPRNSPEPRKTGSE